MNKCSFEKKSSFEESKSLVSVVGRVYSLASRPLMGWLHHKNKMRNVITSIETALESLDLSSVTRAIMQWPKGKFMPTLHYASKLSGIAAAHKGLDLTKQVSVQICAGKDYSELAEVKAAIAAGERGEVQPLKGRTWEVLNFTLISDKTGERLVRLYPIKGKTAKSRFYLGKVEITREQAASYLQPAKALELLQGKKVAIPCYDKKESELIGLGETEEA